jgi:hypothetical protein
VSLLTLPCCGCTFNGQSSSPNCCTDVGFFAERYNTNQTLFNGVETKVIQDTVLWDTRGDFDLSNSWFLVPFEGRYGFAVSADVSTPGSARVDARIYQNGTQRAEGNCYPPASSTAKPAVSCYLWCQPGDQIEFRLWASSFGSSTLLSCNNQFSGSLTFDNS